MKVLPVDLGELQIPLESRDEGFSSGPVKDDVVDDDLTAADKANRQN
jgi:hypothetical protein